MDPNASLSLAGNVHRIGFITHTMVAALMTFQGKRPGVQVAVNKTSAAHYTEENRTIPETRPSPAIWYSQNGSRAIIF
jgi:hypothetical protein